MIDIIVHAIEATGRSRPVRLYLCFDACAAVVTKDCAACASHSRLLFKRFVRPQQRLVRPVAYRAAAPQSVDCSLRINNPVWDGLGLLLR